MSFACRLNVTQSRDNLHNSALNVNTFYQLGENGYADKSVNDHVLWILGLRAEAITEIVSIVASDSHFIDIFGTLKFIVSEVLATTPVTIDPTVAIGVAPDRILKKNCT